MPNNPIYHRFFILWDFNIIVSFSKSLERDLQKSVQGFFFGTTQKTRKRPLSIKRVFESKRSKKQHFGHSLCRPMCRNGYNIRFKALLFYPNNIFQLISDDGQCTHRHSTVQEWNCSAPSNPEQHANKVFASQQSSHSMTFEPTSCSKPNQNQRNLYANIHFNSLPLMDGLGFHF